MKYKTFEGLLQNCLDLYNTGIERDKTLEKAIGGDTQIFTDWWDTFITETINSIKYELNDKSDFVDWLFWDNMTTGCESKYQSFTVDGIEYVGNSKNIYLELTGMLDERFGKTVHKDICVDELHEKDINHIVKDGSPWSKVSSPELHVEKVEVKEQDRNLDSEYTVEQSDEIEAETTPEAKEEAEEKVTNILKDEIKKFHKMLLLKDKQIELESTVLAQLLEIDVQDVLKNNCNIDEFSSELNKGFNSLMLDAKHKDTLIKMENQFRMVLINLVGPDTTDLSMADFEVKKVLYNLKEMGSIFSYEVHTNDGKIEGTWEWEDINERKKSFSIEIGEELEIGFK